MGWEEAIRELHKLLGGPAMADDDELRLEEGQLMKGTRGLEMFSTWTWINFDLLLQVFKFQSTSPPPPSFQR